MHTTLNEINKHQPCKPSWKVLLKSLGKTKADDEPVTYEYILDTLGIEDAIWSLRCYPDDKAVKRFACDCAEGALKFFEVKYPDDVRPRECINAARDFIDGKITHKDLIKFQRAAAAAAAAAAYAAAAAAAADAAADAAYAAAAAADAAAYAAAAYAVRSKQREEQAVLFREYFCKEAA